jgi:hypothetical protein
VTAALSPPVSGVRTAGWPSAVGAPFDAETGKSHTTIQLDREQSARRFKALRSSR